MKKLFTLLAISAITAASMAQTPIPTNGLAAYYPFNGNTQDESGNGNDLKANGGSFGVDRASGNSAYILNGTSDFLYTKKCFTQNELTVSIWVNIEVLPQSQSGGSEIFTNGQGGYSGFGLKYEPDFGADLKVMAYHNVGGFTNCNYTPPVNKWVNYVVTKAGSYFMVYIDGKLNSSGTPNALNTPIGLMLFGATTNNTDTLNVSANHFLKGSLDDIRIYERVLDSTEVKLLYNEPLCNLSINKQPANLSIRAGEGSEFVVNATGTNISYTWQKKTGTTFTNMVNDCNFSDVNGNTLQLNTMGSAFSNTYYRCIISNNICSDTTNIVKLRLDTNRVTVFDTTHIIIRDTLYKTVFDTVTTHFVVNDTIHINQYDTVKIAVTDTLIIRLNTTVGINQLYLTSIKVYPNPTADFITIDNGEYNKLANYSIQIFNMQGQSVYQTSIIQQQNIVNLSTLGITGTYYLKVFDNSGKEIENRKILLTK